MATPTYRQVTARWYAIAVVGRGSYLQHPNVLLNGDQMLSDDGSVLAEVIRNRNGTVRCFLLNGDGGRGTRFRNQQWEVRAVVQAQMFPTIILPFTALEAAEIDRSTINPVDVREDEWINIRHWVESFDIEEVKWTSTGSPYRLTGTIDSRPELYLYKHTHRYGYSRNGKYEYTPVPEAEQSIDVHLRPWTRLFTNSEGFGGRWYWDENRHRLGDSLFRAKAHGTYRTFVSSFDYQESNPLYFLAELPWKARPTTVDEAIDALAPSIVHQARKQKRVVRRQGDIFSIPTELSTKDVKARTNGELIRMRGVMGTDHVVTEQYVGKRGVTYARGFMYHKPEGRRADHRRVPLGKAWHLIVPNAVPRRRAGAMVRG